MDCHIAYICAGSNMGDKVENCRKGIDMLVESSGNILLVSSPFYRTDPVDYKDQDWFINVVVKIETSLVPLDLLEMLKTIEKRMGRTDNSLKFGPRILDMDIILYDDMILQSSNLTIPHPRMHKRCFVLKPLCDIDPDIVHPGLKQDVRYLLDNIDNNSQGVFLYSC